MKFPKEGRWCFCIGIVDRGDGPVGERGNLFDYTEKNIIYIKGFNELIKTAIREIKKLPRDTAGWFISNREPDVYYLNDSVKTIPGVKGTKASLLAKNGISTVQDLMILDEKELNQIAKSTKGLAIAGLSKLQDSIASVICKNAPKETCYLDSDNPYAARYGTEKDEWGVESWVTFLKSTPSFSGVVCITDLVQHIARETKEFYKGTKHESDFYFYHDALKQLTHKDTVAWMKRTIVPGTSRSIYNCWIKPELGLNDCIGPGWNRPTGDCAELMPLDNSCNQDIHESAKTHVVSSRSGVEYGDKDPRIFSMATPKMVTSTYTRLFHPVTGVVPKPHRIVQDVHKAVNAMSVIHNAKGAFVPGLAGGRVPGHRHTATDEKTSNNWGGRREKLEYNFALDDESMHVILKSLLNDPE